MGTFHRPKPTRGISLPEAKVMVDFAIVSVIDIWQICGDSKSRMRKA